MKYLKVSLQKSILVFSVLFLAACERDAESTFYPTALPYDSVKIYPQTKGNTPPIVIPDDRLEKPGNFKYLTLFDASKKNTIVIKIQSDDQQILNLLNAETVKLITFERLLPGGVTVDKITTHKLEQRTNLKQVEIEVVETHIQKDIRLYGLKLIKSDLTESHSSYLFVYKNSNVSFVQATGKDLLKNISSYSAQSSECPDCEIQHLVPHFFEANMMLAFYANKNSDIILSLAAKLGDDILILW